MRPIHTNTDFKMSITITIDQPKTGKIVCGFENISDEDRDSIISVLSREMKRIASSKVIEKDSSDSPKAPSDGLDHFLMYG